MHLTSFASKLSRLRTTIRIKMLKRPIMEELHLSQKVLHLHVVSKALETIFFLKEQRAAC